MESSIIQSHNYNWDLRGLSLVSWFSKKQSSQDHEHTKLIISQTVQVKIIFHLLKGLRVRQFLISSATTMGLSDRRILSTSDTLLFLRLNILHLKSSAMPLNPFWMLSPRPIEKPNMITLNHFLQLLLITCLLPNCQIVTASKTAINRVKRYLLRPPRKSLRNCFFESKWYCSLVSIGSNPLLGLGSTLVEARSDYDLAQTYLHKSRHNHTIHRSSRYWRARSSARRPLRNWGGLRSERRE